MTTVTILGGVLFVVTGLHLAGWRARRSVWLLSAGVGAIGLASIVRADDIKMLVGGALSPAGAEAFKHGLIAVGCLFVGLWAAGAVSGRLAGSAQAFVMAAIVMFAMAIPFVCNGPWGDRDLTLQSQGKPWMLMYWCAYYGAFIAANVLFGRSAARDANQMTVPQKAPLTMMATGGTLAVLWAVLSIGRQVTAMQGDALPSALESIRNGLEPAFTLLLGGGLMILAGVTTVKAWEKGSAARIGDSRTV